MSVCSMQRILGPCIAPAGASVIPAGSFVIVAGMSTIVQWRIGAPFRRTSVSCMITTYVFVPAGPAVHSSPGNLFPWYCVFSTGISPMFLNAGDVTVSVAFPLAGALVSASWAIPTSGSLGGDCAESAEPAIVDRARARSIIGLLRAKCRTAAWRNSPKCRRARSAERREMAVGVTSALRVGIDERGRGAHVLTSLHHYSQ